MTAPDVAVLGGGIIGLACARELAGQGLAVTLVERDRPGLAASYAAGGMLAPLSEAPQPGPFVDICRQARSLWGPWVHELEEETGARLDYDISGTLLVALNPAQEAWLEELAARAQEHGEPFLERAPESLRQEVPDLTDAVTRALHLEGEHRVDNTRVCAALLQAVQGRGVKVETRRPVERVERAGDGVALVARDWRLEAGALVLAAGAWSGRIGGLPQLPVRPVRGQMLMLRDVEWPWSGVVRGVEVYAVRRGVTGLLLGSTVEEAGFTDHPTLGGIESLVRAARRLFPGLADKALVATWAGLRPASPDLRPIVGRIPEWPAFAATAHYRDGILLAPWTAQQIARWIAHPEEEEPDQPFSPCRFL